MDFLGETRGANRNLHVGRGDMHSRVSGADRLQMPFLSPCDDHGLSPLQEFLGEASTNTDPPPVIGIVLINIHPSNLYGITMLLAFAGQPLSGAGSK